MRIRKASGFTLLELMIAVAIVGILVRLSLNYSGSMTREQKFREVIRGVMATAQRARGQALGAGKNVLFSLENNCATAFVDLNGDRLFQANTDTFVFRYPADATKNIDSGITLTANGIREVVGPSVQTATFDARGFFIDSFYNVARHDIEICVRDTTPPGREQPIVIGRFGSIETMKRPCRTHQDYCNGLNLRFPVRR